MQENLGQKDEDLLPLLKVANTIANKIMQGSMRSTKIEDYIKALARSGGVVNEDTDMIPDEGEGEGG